MHTALQVLVLVIFIGATVGLAIFLRRYQQYIPPQGKEEKVPSKVPIEEGEEGEFIEIKRE